MLGQLVLALADLDNCAVLADIAAAMSVEESAWAPTGVRGTSAEHLRPQADRPSRPVSMTRILAGSPIVASHGGPDCPLVDAYSLRCAPQVAGAARDTVRIVADRELASVVDNPIITDAGTVESTGTSTAPRSPVMLDFLAIAVADLAASRKRRTKPFLDAARNRGLNAFLADDRSRRRTHDRSTPDAIVSNSNVWPSRERRLVPSSTMQEDHVSMGWSATLAQGHRP